VCELQLPDGVKGPFFVSIGDAEKLNKFLELNPYIPKQNAFVDGYSMDAYKKVGFGSFRDVDPEKAKKVKMTAPDLGGAGGWWNYATNVMALSPIEKGVKVSGVPEGVLQLGGTFVVKGDDVVYQWSDTVPGDTPDLTEVLKIMQGTVSE
jgi:hypothetical protein